MDAQVPGDVDAQVPGGVDAHSGCPEVEGWGIGLGGSGGWGDGEWGVPGRGL